jgi:hypothetical protein
MWDEMPEDVRLELLDPKYLTRTHHKKATYAKGCRGPLCRKEEREEGERKRQALALSAGKEYKPKKRTAGDIHRDELLNKIYAWHLTMRQAPDVRKALLVSFNLEALSA